MAAIHERRQVRREVQLRVTHPSPYPTISHPIRCSPPSLRTLLPTAPYAVFHSQPACSHSSSRCAPRPNHTPSPWFGTMGVQEGRIAHRAPGSGPWVCKKAESHTESLVRDHAVCRMLELHTEPSARLSGMTWCRPGYWSGISQSAVGAGLSGGSAKGCWPTTWL